MAINNVRIYDRGGHECVPVWEWQVDSSATLIYPGEPVKLAAAGSPFVIKLADDEPVIGTTTQVIGIAASTSDNDSSNAGSVKVYIPLQGVIYAAKATTAANVDTEAELNALVGDRVVFDLIGTTFTVDENATDTAASGLQIVGGSHDDKEIYFTIRPAATEGPIA